MDNKYIKIISCGMNHSTIYWTNSDLLVFDSNSHGQLGFDDIMNINKPTLLMNNKDISKQWWFISFWR